MKINCRVLTVVILQTLALSSSAAPASGSKANSTYWQKLNRTDAETILSRPDVQQMLKSRVAACLYTLEPDLKTLKEYLRKAPDEGAPSTSIYFDIPLPYADFLELPYYRSHVMDPELEKKFPDHLSFKKLGIPSHATDISSKMFGVELLGYWVDGLEKRIRVDNFRPVVGGVLQDPIEIHGKTVYFSMELWVLGPPPTVKMCEF